MRFISPINVERKLENNKNINNSKDSVTKLCFITDNLPKHPLVNYILQ